MGSRCARLYLQTQKIKKSAETTSAREMTRKQTKAKRGGERASRPGVGRRQNMEVLLPAERPLYCEPKVSSIVLERSPS
ncbi:hypothetical protein NDU88_005237 [Pleurodeles waltl]|uniref:Uncharacterized protein n=1 Tax=Pleurodeles waltl TaxID=8319 RepID=A0AAV7VM64_PLEWA|nr:hypothetical protein NDU88_005237 [Pleurodeles waltl]